MDIDLHAECDGCQKEEAPLFDSDRRYQPPAGWKQVEEYIFCAECWVQVRIAIERAVAALLYTRRPTAAAQ